MKDLQEDLATLRLDGMRDPAPGFDLLGGVDARCADVAWPGNVRELRNVLERAAILCDGELIESEHLSLNVRPIASSVTPLTDLRAAERRAIENALRETDGNKSKTARRLGLTRTQLYVRLRKYEIDQPALS